VKHITCVTKSVPSKAAAWQDILCLFNTWLVGILSAVGGNLPLADWLDGKCNPESQGGTTT
jgi:hypothetical protein